MAEPVSSIITIALLGVAVVRGCKTYIDAVREVDELVDRLSRKVTDLHRMVSFLNSKYQEAEHDSASQQSLIVRGKITQCRNKFREIKPRILELKARSTESFVDKVYLERKMNTVAKDIEVAVDEIRQCLMDIVLVTGACSQLIYGSSKLNDNWFYGKALTDNHNQPPIPRDSIHNQTVEDDSTVLGRWLSNAETILEPVQIRRDSTTTSSSRPSVSSLSSKDILAQSDADDESIVSAQTPVTLDPSEDWRDFHKTVLRCEDGSALIEEVNTMLEKHPQPSALVNILGDHQRAPLHLAAMRGNVELAHILLAFGGDIHAKDTDHASVLDHALANKQVDFITLLLDKGVDETAILDRNMGQLKETKGIIAFRKMRKQDPPREKTRKSSWGFGRRRSK
ncbi:hypothetical protein IG631_10495 [Alternaria alternata]|nr:hypothetical protein IG631_10495 [Alternaria alternata]